MNIMRIQNITLNEKGHMYFMAEKRKQYVSHLHEHKHDSYMNKVDQTKILNWAKRKIAYSFKISCYKKTIQ